ncbi:DUF3950 domain-containing protein [Escherichia coli]|nr:DUF3950 domain-containing protein [Escherichia coli O25]EFH4002306.1 DUF3950 domain-containing protein [Escherichia coli]QTY38855.1 DUF3950 domain-containing protein [Escherichia coli O128ac:H12]HDQ6474019.1 DUF3950 domain-containing protein [Escherichia coli O25 str. E39a]EFI4617991.1 DUF3950 domain-containing protein [Escherichia coli]
MLLLTGPEHHRDAGDVGIPLIEACRRRLTSEKRAYTSIQSDDG